MSSSEVIEAKIERVTREALKGSEVYANLDEEGQKIFREGILNMTKKVSDMYPGRWCNVVMFEVWKVLDDNSEGESMYSRLKRELTELGVKSAPARAGAIKASLNATVNMLCRGLEDYDRYIGYRNKIRAGSRYISRN